MTKVQTIDPNWPCNDGEYDFPVSVVRGWRIGLDDDWTVVRETCVLETAAKFELAFNRWKRLNENGAAGKD